MGKLTKKILKSLAKLGGKSSLSGWEINVIFKLTGLHTCIISLCGGVPGRRNNVSCDVNPESCDETLDSLCEGLGCDILRCL